MPRRLARAGFSCALLLLVSPACGRPVKPDQPPGKPEIELQTRGVFSDTTDQVRGLSDLSRDTTGQLWAIPERQNVLLRAVLTAGEVGWEPLTLEGKPQDCDGEALTWVAPRQFAIGTERHVDARDTDLVLLGHVSERRAIIDQQVPMPYSLWGIRADDNKGIEGLCAAAGQLLAGVEMVMVRDGHRDAPLGRYDLGTKTWTGLRLRLTSTTGKLSALACAAQPDGAIALWAVERHYGVTRWLRAVVPTAGQVDVIAVVHADLAVPMHAALGTVPNVEGIAGDPQDPMAVWLIADNDSGGRVSGPNLLLRLGPAGAPNP